MNHECPESMWENHVEVAHDTSCDKADNIIIYLLRVVKIRKKSDIQTYVSYDTKFITKESHQIILKKLHHVNV